MFTRRITCVVAACLGLASWMLTSGCASPSSSARPASDGDQAALASDKGGAQLWSENCSRCHNARSPDYYTPGRWAVVSQHMRVRAYLTGGEERQILAFLQSQ